MQYVTCYSTKPGKSERGNLQIPRQAIRYISGYTNNAGNDRVLMTWRFSPTIDAANPKMYILTRIFKGN